MSHLHNKWGAHPWSFLQISLILTDPTYVNWQFGENLIFLYFTGQKDLCQTLTWRPWNHQQWRARQGLLPSEESGNTFGRRPSHENEHFTLIKFYLFFKKQDSNWFKNYMIDFFFLLNSFTFELLHGLLIVLWLDNLFLGPMKK